MTVILTAKNHYCAESARFFALDFKIRLQIMQQALKNGLKSHFTFVPLRLEREILNTTYD